jgi:hypothetical protein
MKIIKQKRNQIVLGIYLVLTLVAIFFVVRSSGFSSVIFWILLIVDLGILALIYTYMKYRAKRELIKCNNCGREMMFEVYEKAHGCPKCHSSSFTRTGVWVKS